MHMVGNILLPPPNTAGVSHQPRSHPAIQPLLQQPALTAAPLPCLQNVLAKMVIDRVPSVEMVRFVNSGTEACLSVVRLMRAYTGREKVSRAGRGGGGGGGAGA